MDLMTLAAKIKLDDGEFRSGVSSAEDVLEMMFAGATAVEVGSANLVEPFAAKEMIEKLPEVLDRYGIENIKDATGGAH